MKRSNGYDALAVYAAKAAKLKDQTPQAAAGSPAARKIRKDLWAEYERRLRDTQTYTIDAVWEWLKTHGATIGRNTAWRDRRKLLEPERAAELAGLHAGKIVQICQEKGLDDILRGGRGLAAQGIFNAIFNFRPEVLELVDADQLVRVINALSKLTLANVQADLGQVKLAEMRRKFDQQMQAAQTKAAKRADGKLTVDDIAEAKKAIFGDTT